MGKYFEHGKYFMNALVENDIEVNYMPTKID